jgi:hypothetical protein
MAGAYINLRVTAGVVMKRHSFGLFVLLGVLAVSPAVAQFVPPPPDLQNRIPAPLPPPPKPPMINGFEGQQNPPPGVSRQPRLRTHGDRATSCLHEGASNGLTGAELDAYSRACVNGQ